MEVRSVQENTKGLPFVFMPKTMLDELGISKQSSVVIVLNKEEKRIEIYSEEAMKERAGL